MNNWDPECANCDAPEVTIYYFTINITTNNYGYVSQAYESEEEKQPADARTTGNHLLFGNSKGPGSLSYRRMLFGSDGRIRVCFNDKNKNGYGIFSFTEVVNNDLEPTRRVSYWWSSAYDQTGVSYGHVKGRKSSSNELLLPPIEDTTDNAIVSDDQLINQSLVSDVSVPPSFNLLNAARRISGMNDLPSVGHNVQKKLPRMLKLLTSMSILQRDHSNRSVVMSCFLVGNSSVLTITKISNILKSIRFLSDEMEACREYMTRVDLKNTIRRLETRGEVEVSYTNTGDLSVELLPSIPDPTNNSGGSKW